jgi:hypothetical protein
MSAMARSHVARQRRCRARAISAGRRLARIVAVVGAAAGALALPLLAGSASPAAAAPAHKGARGQPDAGPLVINVTSMSPSYAADRRTITLSGRVRNVSRATITGLTLQLDTSDVPLASSADVIDFAHGTLAPAEEPVAGPSHGVSRLGPGQAWTWTARVPVSALGLTCFGVYPLTAVVSDSATQAIASYPVPLPFWPSKAGTCPAQPRPAPQPISWVWPLIDAPQQSPCPGMLLSNSLAGAVAPGGRLNYLVAVGRQYAAAAKLTWAVDPALLDNLRTMRTPYLVGSSPTCSRPARFPANTNAAAWLTSLSKATAGQPLFVTPYGDVDISALVQDGNPDLAGAFADGDQVARKVLGRDPTPAALPAVGKHDLSSIVWPAGGTASQAVEEKLAQLNVSTLMLTMPYVPPGQPSPGAVTSVLTGLGTTLHVLLADHGISELLSSRAAVSRQPGSIFGVSQLYLAETAELAAQWPGHPRGILVAPPRRWDPARSLASALLSDTVHAPWLSPASTSQLAALPAKHATPPKPRPGRQLSGRLLRGVRKLDRRVRLLESVWVDPNPVLLRAVYGIESSRWRAGGGKTAAAMLANAERYVQNQLSQLTIGVGKKLYVTLGGKETTVRVVIHNLSNYTVRVGVTPVATNCRVSSETGPVTIPARSFSGPVKFVVHADGTSTGTIVLSLTSTDGTRLPAKPLTMQVRPTDFGTVALVICAAALAVFVIASAARAIRSGRRPPAQPGAPGAGGNPEPPLDSPEVGNQPEHTDSVLTDPPELTSAGQTVSDHDRSATSRPAPEEHR